MFRYKFIDHRIAFRLKSLLLLLLLNQRAEYQHSDTGVEIYEFQYTHHHTV